MKIGNDAHKRIFTSLCIAFVCGVLVQLVQITIFNTAGIDRILGSLVSISMLIIPIHIAVVASYVYQKDWRYVAITGTTTMLFAEATLRMYAIG
ncbi:MAG TPA: hypothetical protein EYP67_07125 [Methanosarcinales archaeon]|nr:hypothetical protein [Methanosarcinales archaeon]